MAPRRSVRNKEKPKEEIESKTNVKPQSPVKLKDEDDGSSSDSSVENYLKTADEIDLNSSFFTFDNVENKPKPEKKIFANIDRLSESSDSDSDNQIKSKENDAPKEKLFVPKEEDFKNISFEGLENFNKKIEETKNAVENYRNMKLKQENKTDIKHLLSVGEAKIGESASFNSTGGSYMSESSSENEMDWEEIEDKKILSQVTSTIPKEGVQITVEMPTTVRKKKKDDYMMVIKRRLNRVKKENQVHMHKVHLLCWIAHGNYVNSILNSQNLLGLSLSLIPNNQCYPPKHADLKYLEQITRWYGKVMKLVEKTVNKIPTTSLEKLLEIQLTKKEANSKKNFVLLFICILRALGLQCRLIFSLRCVPLRPPSSQLCSLSTKDKTDESKNKSKKKQRNEENEDLLPKSEGQSKPNIKNLKKNLPGSSKDANKSVKEDEKVTNNSRSSLTPKNRRQSLIDEKKTKVPDISKNEKILKSNRKLSVKSESTTDAQKSKIINKNEKNEENTKQKGANDTVITRNKQLIRKVDKDQDNIELTSVHCSKQTRKSNTEKSDKRQSVRRSRLGTKRDDSEEDFQPDRRNFSPEKAHTSNVKDIKLSPTKRSDVRDIIVNLIKSDMTDHKNAEKQKRVSRKKKVEEDSEDSDYFPEPVKKPKSSKNNDSGDEFKRKSTVKVKQRVKPKGQIDSRVLSTDDDEDSQKPEKPEKVGNDVWVEVFLEAEEKWISVDVLKAQVHCVAELHSRASTPITYILAWNNNLTIKDVTSRYCTHMNTVTRKLRIDSNWWNESLKPFLGRKTARDKEEDEDLARQQLDQPLPKIISEYKNHPLYALKRHLLKFEAIYPEDALTLGFVRSEPVYARECVYTLHSRDIWLKHAKIVKPGQTPYKIVKARPKYDKLTGNVITDKPLEIFGPWQVEDYIPPTAENGVVPRNAFGNVELFKACMLPKGTVHLQLPGLNKIARRLQIDCAPALVGFDFHSGWSHPTYDGFVVCEEFGDQLIQAWEQEQDEIAIREQEKIEKRVYDNWRKLIKGLLIRERLKAKYEFDGPSGSGKGKKKSKGPRFVSKKRRVVSGSESD